jgi:large subunit ribosomal protein L21
LYAVINDRSRQHTVREGDVLLCDLMAEKAPGDTVVFDRVLLIGDEGAVKVGQPFVAGARVTAEVLGEEKGDKVVAFRFKRRKNVRVKQGHRQRYTRVRVRGIES